VGECAKLIQTGRSRRWLWRRLRRDDGWVCDEVGGIASFACQYFFNLSDIILDLNTKQPKGNILNWQSEDVDFNMFNEKQQHINYKSYTMGLRHEQLKNVSNEK
jgi:hypothetical protein